LATKVTQPMLTDAANKAEIVGEGIAGQLTALLGTIETQGAASFKGGGGNALQSTSQQLGTSLQKLLTALNSMAEAVHASNVQYGSTDQEVSREITATAGTYSDSPVVSALRG
jgi:uncharacterized protein YukE